MRLGASLDPGSSPGYVRSRESTLFMGLVAGLQALLYRYSGQHDVIVGTPIAGRQHSDLEDQIGFYINTVALPTRLDVEEGFSGLLAKVREVTLGAYQHQVYPFDALVEDLSPGKRHQPPSSL